MKRAGGGSGSAGSIRPPSGPGRARSLAPYHCHAQGHARRPKRPQTGHSSSHRPTPGVPKKPLKNPLKIGSLFLPPKNTKNAPQRSPQAPEKSFKIAEHFKKRELKCEKNRLQLQNQLPDLFFNIFSSSFVNFLL